MKINIQNLKNGVHEFEFKITAESLELEKDLAKFSDIYVLSTVNKNDDTLIVGSRFTVPLDIACDNCLKMIRYDLKDEFTVVYTADRDVAEHEEEGDFVYLRAHAKEIDLSKGLRSCIALAAPMRIVCSHDCKGLCAVCGVNLNATTCQCKVRNADPRWEGLRGLFDRNANIV